MQLVSAQTSIADRRRASAAKSRGDIMRLEEDSTTLDYGAYNSAESVISLLTGKTPVFACQQGGNDSGATDAPSFDSSGFGGDDDHDDDSNHSGLGPLGIRCKIVPLKSGNSFRSLLYLILYAKTYKNLFSKVSLLGVLVTKECLEHQPNRGNLTIL